ncbi:MAG: anti-sigma factor [Gaiellaceae bacterium]
MEARDLHELTSAYALDALGADETQAYEAHLGHCERCRAELATLADPVAALAWAVEAPAPPPRLRARILDAAAAERENVLPLPVRRPWVLRATATVGAVAACLAIGFGFWAGSLSNSVTRERATSASALRAVQILADPTARRATLSDGRGVVAVDRTSQGVLVVDRLPAAPSGKTYEAWVIPAGGDARPAGTFHGGGAMSIIRLQEMVPQGAVVAATVERAGGVDKPTQAPVFSARV